jgi:hypothetical protein
MKRKIILTENQIKKIIESRVNDFNMEDITNNLSKIECSGADLKFLVRKILKNYGYEDIKVLFLGHDDITKDLRYIVHTEGPVFTYKSKSEVTADNKPCLSIYDVKVYKEI